ncbi:hypothetical protein HN011_002174 [Eciton burchellii]|nr:hypothetical protein HN011_002174 [Eciton burchellii]
MDKQENLLRINLERPLYEYEALNQTYNYERPERLPLRQRIINRIKSKDWGSCLMSTIPGIKWLSKYNWKKDIVPDIVAGLTVAVMHIPQGMAYALLGNLPPVVGIYMAIFPVFIYFLLGTSRHVSIGTFAVVCLMTGKIVSSYSTPLMEEISANASEAVFQSSENVTYTYMPIEVATAVTFTVGIYQIIMYAFRLGIVTTLLSESLINSFTTAAAVYVLISQIKDLFGLKLLKRYAYFRLIYTVIDIFKEIKNTNITAVILSVTAISILVFNNELLKPKKNKKYSIPVPMELLVVIGGTLISRYCDLVKNFNIEVVGRIPTGFPKPKVPNMEILPIVAVDSISITLVSYTITISLALIFAEKLNYEINSNQELFAMGLSNIVGSFFSCMPISASLSRSLIQQTVGGRTQIASIVSCLLLLVILLWIGPFFEPLPKCILASIIVVALKGMLIQAKQFVKFWKLNKSDAIIWLITFSIVILIDIDIGLLAGLLVSLIVILLKSIRPYTCLLGHIPDTDLYLDLSRYKAAVEIKGIKIFHYCGNLNFINNNNFKFIVYKLVGVRPQDIIDRNSTQEDHFLGEKNSEDGQELRCIIMDMSALSYIDSSSVHVLHLIVEEFAEVNIEFYFAGCSSPIFEMIMKYDIYVYDALTLKIFATVQDAVTFFQTEVIPR